MGTPSNLIIKYILYFIGITTITKMYLIYWEWIWVTSAIPRNYSWLCSQKPLLAGSGELKGCQGSNLGWHCARLLLWLHLILFFYVLYYFICYCTLLFYIAERLTVLHFNLKTILFIK